MRERPIPFSAPMVRAILAGAKTQTRRVVTPAPVFWQAPFPDGSWQWDGGSQLLRAGFGAAYVHTDAASMANIAARFCRYGKPGDRLWVRETWAPCPDRGAPHTVYRADNGLRYEGETWKWRPSIFMPRWASRTTLEITGVRVEHLQAISEADAMAEGVEPLLVPPDGGGAPHVEGYRALWESIHGVGSWDANPWVWVVEFRRA